MMENRKIVVKKSKTGKIIIIVLISILVLAVLSAAWFAALLINKYQQGVKLLEAQEYEEAIKVFEEFPENSFTDLRIRSAYYGLGEAYYSDGEYEEAIANYEKAEGYRDSEESVSKCLYNLGIMAQQEEDHLKAIEYYTLADGYAESEEKIKSCYYYMGIAHLNEGEYDNAREMFSQSGDYSDSQIKLVACDYYQGHSLFVDGYYDEAEVYLKKAEDFGEYVPHFRNFSEAESYLRAESNKLSIKVMVCLGELPDGVADEESLLLLIYNYMNMKGASIDYDEEEKVLTVFPGYYSGHRILYSHINGDENMLTESESTAYEKALSVVEQAKAETESWFELELWLHDWICNNTVYDSPEAGTTTDYSYLNCIGVLLEGKANCQGYADTFYLLASLAGFETRIVGSETHAWNTIKLNDKWYLVDATFNDLAGCTADAKQYVWFNSMHGSKDHEPYGGVVQYSWMCMEEDYSMTYYSVNNCIFSDTYSAADYLVKQNIRNGKTWTHIMIEDKEISHYSLSSAVKSALDRYTTGYKSWREYWYYDDGNTYFTIYWAD